MAETAAHLDWGHEERPTAAETLLKVERVTKNFAGTGANVAAIHNIDLDVRQGEFLVILGPSGCGKSTLLNIIAGFEKPSSGRVLIGNKPIAGPGPDRQVMFQEHALFPWLNVIDNVCYGLKNLPGLNRKKRYEIARRMLATVHLEDFERAYVHELSGGMKHRAALARALATDPRLLLIDEPFPALDVVTKQRLWEVLESATATSQKTVVYVTHDPREAVFLGDRIVMLSTRPARIIEEVQIRLRRPRRVDDPEIGRLSGQVTEKLIRARDDGR